MSGNQTFTSGWQDVRTWQRANSMSRRSFDSRPNPHLTHAVSRNAHYAKRVCVHPTSRLPTSKVHNPSLRKKMKQETLPQQSLMLPSIVSISTRDMFKLYLSSLFFLDKRKGWKGEAKRKAMETKILNFFHVDLPVAVTTLQPSRRKNKRLYTKV